MRLQELGKREAEKGRRETGKEGEKGRSPGG